MVQILEWIFGLQQLDRKVQNSFFIRPALHRATISQKKFTILFTKRTRQKLLSGFFPLRGGGYPPFPLRVFGQDDFPLRGEGGNPNSAKENSAKKQVF